MQGAAYGRFERQLALGTAVDAAQTEADYRDGILEIRIPKAETSRPRTIPVRTATPRPGEREGTEAAAAGAPRQFDMRGAGTDERAAGGRDAGTGARSGTSTSASSAGSAGAEGARQT